VALPRWGRSERVILHELAHHATPRYCAAHGPEYARTFLDLVRHFMGREVAQQLEEAFESHRVKVAE
jgi:putative metallohydrolase (TIGR04338 family)